MGIKRETSAFRNDAQVQGEPFLKNSAGRFRRDKPYP
jgi:hypothetical protein